MIQIKDIFAKDINRDIRGVIKIGQDSDDIKQQELEEYVVTDELKRNFTRFFDAYDKSINNPTDEMGAWISGFFGSGKSHFLKILSYLLENDTVKGRQAIDYFLQDGKFDDDHLADAINKATSVPTEVALFNIDSKADSNAANNDNSILDVFLKVFNEQLGYSPIAVVADMERWLDSVGKYEAFKQAFADLATTDHSSWVELRKNYALMSTKIKTALVNCGALDETDANNYVQTLLTKKFSIDATAFAKLVKDYLDKKGNDAHFVFLADEVGQFIGDNNSRMLNLQTIVEQLGVQCQGRAWVVVTSQQQMDEVASNFSKYERDFSKIQGRFNTLINMSSANADEVIRKRLLTKKPLVSDQLADIYSQEQYSINNKINFSDAIKRQKFDNAQEFVENYPFIPYQFSLLKEVLTAVRQHGANGSHMSDGERSMLGTFQEATKRYENDELGRLVPFSAFFIGMKEFLSHDHQVVFDRAQTDRYVNKNNEDYCFNIQVLAVLFMVRYVDNYPSTLENIVTLLLDSVDQDRQALTAEVKDALNVLMRQNYIQKKLDTYQFLTDSEREVNEAINAIEVDDRKVAQKIGSYLLTSNLIDAKYTYPHMKNQYIFEFNEYIDEMGLNRLSNNLNIQIISPLIADNYREIDFKQKAMDGKNIIIVLKDDDRYIENYRHIEKISAYLQKPESRSDDKKQEIAFNRKAESKQVEEATQKMIKDDLIDADIYVLDDVLPKGSNFESRLEQAKIVAELNRHGYQEDSKTAYKDFVKEVAYTWFNRIIAIRFMEVNNYLPSRVRVISSEEGRNEPDIINEAMEIGDDLGGYSNQEKELITTALTEKTPELMDSLYTMLFIKQCDALSEILPGLFEETSNYLKLLFTPHYDRGVIKELVNEIPEEYFDVEKEGQVQIIGWLYQYYNNAPHEEVVNMNGKAIQKDEIPAATQLFTPDWIVRYMVDNSLGKYYLERHPDSIVKHELKYLLPDEIKAINENQDITDYKLLDNAMGSGHILVYAFELFMKMYIEQGYSNRDAAQKIIENNLFGLEIDKRAFQLAYFSIMMKGREYDRRFLRRNPTTNLYYFEDLYVSDEFYNFISDKVVRDNLKKVVKDFSDATELGSIIKIDESIDLDSIEEVVAGLDFESGLDVFGYKKIQQQILKTLKIIKVMTTKYEAVVTNPPYMNKFDKTMKKYLRDNYKNYSKDLFSVFIYHNVHQLIKGGYAGYMTPLVWMFIKTYEPLRHNVINNFKIDSLIQMEYSAFEEATVPIDTFVLKNSDDKIGTYLRLSNFKGGMIIQEQKVLEAISAPTVKYLYHTDQSNFDKIPGSPIAYWASENLINDFEKGTPLGELVNAKEGMGTSDNKKFIREWFEVDINNICFNAYDIKSSVQSQKKWFPYNKGGSFRKWYGNYDFLVNWENNGYEIRNFKWPNGKIRSNVRNEEYYFRDAITWPLITSGEFSMRYRKLGSIHDVSGKSAFSKDTNLLKYILGFGNSKVMSKTVKILNPTINFQNGDVVRVPILKINNEKDNNKILNFVDRSLILSKKDWDAFETSWDFQKSPLLTQNAVYLHQAYDSWSDEALTRFNQLKSNEEELNRIFINLYGLQDELTPEEDDKEVSVRKADQVRDIKAFLSYFIGCVFGRYSLDQDGLVYAGGDWDASKYTTFKPNKENIILLTDRQYFDDDRDIIVRLKEFLTKTFDPETLTENMDFIAQTLEPKKFERGASAEDIIRTYFLNDFYKDHAKIYQKRPIYWEFNSGRNKGFKALMYLHRYNTEQLPMVRHYLHELQPAMNDLIEVDQNLLEQETTASVKSKYRKAIANLNKQMNEIMKYDQILDHLSQDPIDLDLDDGVLVNHDKLQQGEKLLSKL